MFKKNYLSFLFCVVFIVSSIAVFADAPPKFTFDSADNKVMHYDVDAGDIIEASLELTMVDDVDSMFEVKAVGENSEWFNLDFTGSLVEVEGGGSIFIPLTIDVPADTSPGDYVVQLRAIYKNESGTAVSGNQSGVVVQSAVGINVKINVSGERVFNVLLKDLSIGDFNKISGLPVTIIYENLGNASPDVFADLSITDFFGELIHQKQYDLSQPLIFSEGRTTIILEPDLYSEFLPSNLEIELFYDSIDENNVESIVSGGVASTTIGSYIYLIAVVSLLIIIVLLIAFKYFKRK